MEVGGKGFFGAYKKLLDACKIPFSIIADRDYIEQIGPEKLKSLFKLNSKEIKVDVLENIKSIDASTLIGAIEAALVSGNWDNSRDIWEYIKSRRRELRLDLNPDEKEEFDSYIHEVAVAGIYLLRQGAIEAYLPIGHKSKDLEKVIDLCAEDDFLNALPAGHRDELAAICDAIWVAHSTNVAASQIAKVETTEGAPV